MIPGIQNDIRPYRLGLILTEQCNISCRHCWFGSGPGKKNRMAPGEAMGYILQIREIPSVDWVSFSGGEPFLFPDLLQKLIAFASGLGLYTECVTNCFWAETADGALKVLVRFKQAGLTVINISTDDFHQQHLPFDRVRNAYNAAKDIGVKIVIMSAVKRSSRITAGQLGQLLEDDGIFIFGRSASQGATTTALAVQSGFLPIGSGADISVKERVIEDRSLSGGCEIALRDISIHPSGKVFPCCSAAGMAETAVLGNAKETGLKKIIREAGRHPFFRVLSTEGPQGLCRYLHWDTLGKSYVNRCHLCYELLTGQESGDWRTWNVETNAFGSSPV
jgi:MoaA/NifB/PqqE/SkfB family radical SAM enzyme